MPRTTSLWHRFSSRLIAALYFQKITVIHRERLPQEGPILYLGLHRNAFDRAFIS